MVILMASVAGTAGCGSSAAPVIPADGGGGGGGDGDGGDGGDGGDTTPVTWSVIGLVTGLQGTLVLQNNLADDQTIEEDGVFEFATGLTSGTDYSVTVLTQPASQVCSVTHGSGTIADANVINVRVVCATNTYTVGGSLSGLTGSVVLQNNAGDNLTLSADGDFVFATAIADGSTYAVSVLTQPDVQTCIVGHGTGTLSGANITDVTVTCSTDTFAVGGTVSGLGAGKSVTLQNNDASNVVVVDDSNPVFTFPIQNDGTSYAVTVKTQPAGQVCTVTQGTGAGTLVGANVTTIAVTCVNSATYTVSGTIVNHADNTGLKLRNNNTDEQNITSATSFAFPTPLSPGDAYDVAVVSQPSRQTCVVTNGTGTFTNANITNVVVTCTTTTPRYIFMTSTGTGGDLRYNGTGTGKDGADYICMHDANRPNGEGNYKALIGELQGNGTPPNRRACDAGCAVDQHIDWVLEPNTTYVRALDGQTVIGTTTSEGIFGTTLDNSFTGTSDIFWTGLKPEWGGYTSSASSDDCNGWTNKNTNNTSYGKAFRGDVTDMNNIQTMSSPVCQQFTPSNGPRLLCVEQ